MVCVDFGHDSTRVDDVATAYMYEGKELLQGRFCEGNKERDNAILLMLRRDGNDAIRPLLWERGVFNLETLAEGNNAACFFMQASIAVTPDISDPLLGAVWSLVGFVTEQIEPLMSKLGCPQLADFNSALFNGFPGASYKAEGQEKSFLDTI
ncbi:hypothetical protein EJ05DRAFT_500488 [Pseudovirgaria hyperparasitica]|uniref:Uncharacterized protein n=1 Tax=Pseudovirgaria hyperparasitica TaxID=470096 RepID=A0A6A6W5U3_9PEZI|nr:uncharacterized protein EJ05DRAFT_500488 [Pseudovirgaria hyperparasitica]KAF2757973.1 hypothetical protein EJ05DRAFT_500488 [Pseudovirgaria hyperparasitica]